MGQEPGINALNVESMAALWQKPQLVISLKLTEADGAIERVLEAYDGLVEENREGVDEGLVDSRVMEVEELLELALEGCDIVWFLRLSVGGSQKVPH